MMLHVTPATVLEAPAENPSSQSKLTKKQARLIKTIKQYGAARSRTKALRALIKELIGTFTSFQQFRHHCIEAMREAYFEDREARLNDPDTNERFAEDRKAAWKTAFRLFAKEQGLTDGDVDIFAIDGNRSGFYDVVLIGKEDPWWKWVRAGKRYGIGEGILVPLRKDKDMTDVSPEEEPITATPAEMAPADIEPAAVVEAASVHAQEAVSIAVCEQASVENVIESIEPQSCAIPAAATAENSAAAQFEQTMAAAPASAPHAEQWIAAVVIAQGETEPTEAVQVSAAAPSASRVDLTPPQPEAIGNMASPPSDPDQKILDRSPGQPAPTEPDRPPRKVMQRNRRHFVPDMPVAGSDEWQRLQQLLRSGRNGNAPAPIPATPQAG